MSTHTLTSAGLLGFGATTRFDTKGVGVPDGKNSIISLSSSSFSLFSVCYGLDEKVSFGVFAQ
jgi:hypothetical protein